MDKFFFRIRTKTPGSDPIIIIHFISFFMKWLDNFQQQNYYRYQTFL